MGIGHQYNSAYTQVASSGEEKRKKEEAASAAEDKRISDLKARGLNPDGSPVRPEFMTNLDKDGNLKEQYRMASQPDVQVDQRATDAIRQEGLRTGPSAWAKMATEKQGLEQTAALDQARQQASGAQSQALSSLMMRGGLGGGSRERLAKGSMRDQMMAAQNTYRQGQLDRSNINLQDETKRMDALKTTTGLDFQNANVGMQNRDYKNKVDQFNLGAAMQGVGAQNQHNMGVYSEEMKKWAADKTAEAQKSAGSSSKK